MRLSSRLIVSDPERESEWRQVLERRLKEPLLYVITVPEDRRYPAEIFTTKEFYKVEEGKRIMGIADGYAAALGLLKTAVEEVLPSDPRLRHLKADFQERYL